MLHRLHSLASAMRRAKRLLSNRRLIERYLASHMVKKLQVGSGLNSQPGWLNADQDPLAPGVIYLDAARRFPFPDGTFDYVFSEHMIEHIPYAAGRNMLRECNRVLRPGGKIRICTPDLAKLIRLYRPDRSQVESDYLAWSTREFIPTADHVDAAFVINNFVRDWGHQFIYDTGVMTRALQDAGFESITRYELGESSDEHLRGLENPSRMPPGFLDIESMTFEAVKR